MRIAMIALTLLAGYVLLQDDADFERQIRVLKAEAQETSISLPTVRDAASRIDQAKIWLAEKVSVRED
ncbi:hypothetical protein [Oceanibacterium hippocampi]|uniref:Uncharacterized protein n=1 Tax=Oceanibacterium hippocampi TaxID=745714 RepID=A0A1Y5T6T6_9PROT|nr:hypothetical protein [Oceanibacterium hippocampi]SLN55257.1 hypothetical protein OCH7691_02373 [Oceanibacterium hippocampi]